MRAIPVLGSLLCCCIVGCSSGTGPNRVEIAGVVTIDGTPIGSGQIVFIPDGGTEGIYSGGEIVDGKFAIPKTKGPTSGNYLVRITGYRSTGKKVSEGSGSESPDQLVDEIEQYVPESYNKNSKLMIDLQTADRKNLRFDLTTSPSS
jgi:hypothetical protein